MSASPNDVQDDVDNKSVDELADVHTADDAEPGIACLFPYSGPSPSVATFLLALPLCLFNRDPDRSTNTDFSFPLI